MNQLFTPSLESMNSAMQSAAIGQANLPSEKAISSNLEYHELGVRHPHETNVLEELKSNLDQLEDLHFRLKFMMSEIAQHTRARK